jgi:succinate dehydrogenase/fumarate reductase cytochrome b subunit
MLPFPPFVIALIIVFGGLWLIRKAGRTPQSAMPGFMQRVAGVGIMGFAGLLAMRGAMQIAVPMFVFGLGLAGKSAAFPNGFNWGKNKSPGQKSRVATSMLAMELDHDSGTMDGEVLAGLHKGKRLSALTQAELIQFHAQCRDARDQTQSLYEAWLDRAHPEWRAAWGQSGSKANASAGAMSTDEAFAVLGLKKGASADDIRSAHKRLMKEFHPDRGGSDYLAAKINAAKDVLLSV